jgi:ankyrin repeat protein
MLLFSLGAIAWMLSREHPAAAPVLWTGFSAVAALFILGLAQLHSRRASEYILLDDTSITSVDAAQQRTLRWELIRFVEIRATRLELADADHVVSIGLSRQLTDFRGVVQDVLAHLESAHDLRSSGARRRPSTTDVTFRVSIRQTTIEFFALMGVLVASALALMDQQILAPATVAIPLALWNLGRTPTMVTVGSIVKVRTLIKTREIHISDIRTITLEADIQGTPRIVMHDVHGYPLGVELSNVPGQGLELYDRIRRLKDSSTGAAGTRGMTTRVAPMRAALLAGSGVLIVAIMFAGSVATGELLRFASKTGSLSLARIAIRSGSPLDARGLEHGAPLHLAARFGRTPIVQLLLTSGANPRTPYHTLRLTPLHIAAEYGRVDIARMLLDSGAIIDAPDRDGWTPLHMAVRNDKRAVAEYLVRLGANVGTLTKNGNTALSLAIIANHPESLRAIINGGGDINVRDGDGWTLLQTSVWSGKMDLLNALLQHGADPNLAADPIQLPLCLAIERGHTEIARVLLNAGAKWDVEADGWTAIQRAAREGNVALVNELIYRGADPRAPSSIAPPPLLIAAERGHLPVVSTLVELGIDPNLRWHDWSALRIAGNRKHYPVIDYLRAHGAN